jgi:hypothetical protein
VCPRRRSAVAELDWWLSLEICQKSARVRELTQLKTSPAETLPALKGLLSQQIPRSRPRFRVLSAKVWQKFFSQKMGFLGEHSTFSFRNAAVGTSVAVSRYLGVRYREKDEEENYGDGGSGRRAAPATDGPDTTY